MGCEQKISELVLNLLLITTHALLQYVQPLGTGVLRKGDSQVNEFFAEREPRKAHDQRASDVQLLGDSKEQNSEDFRNNAQVSVSALIDTRAAANQEALDLASIKFVHRRSTVLRRCRHNSLPSLISAIQISSQLTHFKQVVDHLLDLRTNFGI